MSLRRRTPPHAWALGLSLLLLALSCSEVKGLGGTTASSRDRLVLTGSSTLAPLMTELAARFEREHPGVRIDVQSGGSGRGIADVRNGVADFGMVSRQLLAEESDLRSWPVARDGVAMVVHQSNTLRALSSVQVRAIYSGRIRDWSALGSEAGRIIVVHKAEGRATLQVFLDYFSLRNPEIQADIIAGENEHAIKTVAGNPRAIGYVSIGTAEEDILHGVGIRLLALDGIAATSENVARGDFPMMRDLVLVARQPAQGLAADFLAFVRSPKVDEQVRAHSFSPLAH